MKVSSLILLAATAAVRASDVRGLRTLAGHTAANADKEVDARDSKAMNAASSTQGSRYSCDDDRGSFLDFAESNLQGQTDAVCSNPELAETCAGIRALQAMAAKYASLPRWHRLNWKAMTIAYPAIALITSRALPLDALRVHRSLGYGNSLRLQGYPEEDVNKAYWSHWDVLSVEDGNLQDRLDGIEQYCKYTAKEYETLKSFAVDTFGTDYSLVQATFGPFASVEEGLFYNSCVSGTDVGSWLVRTDWEHHRREVIGSLMDTSVTEAIVTYTVWHWESLFSMLLAPDLAIPTLVNSFDVFLETFGQAFNPKITSAEHTS